MNAKLQKANGLSDLSDAKELLSQVQQHLIDFSKDSVPADDLTKLEAKIKMVEVKIKAAEAEIEVKTKSAESLTKKNHNK
jgi:hypothetical protein